MNALCAAAAACAAGATLDHIARGSRRNARGAGPAAAQEPRHGAWLIDDSYNANPSSMHAGIEVLAELEGRKWLVMGDMGELGDFAEESSQRDRRVRARARHRAAVRDRQAVGARGRRASARARSGSRTPRRWRRRSNAELTREVRVLVKGSRSNRLERVVEALVGERPKQGYRALLARQATHALLLGLQRLLVPDVARDLSRRSRRSRFSLIVGPSMIARLSRYQIGQVVRDDGPKTHSAEGRHADDGRRADPRRDPLRARCCGRTCATASCGWCSASRSRSASSASTTTT